MFNLTEAFRDITPSRPSHRSLVAFPPENVAVGAETDAGLDRLIADLRVRGFLWNDRENAEAGRR